MPLPSNRGSPQSNRPGRGAGLPAGRSGASCALWPARNSSTSTPIIFKKSDRQEGASSRLELTTALDRFCHSSSHSCGPKSKTCDMPRPLLCPSLSVCPFSLLMGETSLLGVLCSTEDWLPRTVADETRNSFFFKPVLWHRLWTDACPTPACLQTRSNEERKDIGRSLNSSHDPAARGTPLTEGQGWGQKRPESGQVSLREYLLHSEYYPLRGGQKVICRNRPRSSNI